MGLLVEESPCPQGCGRAPEGGASERARAMERGTGQGPGAQGGGSHTPQGKACPALTGDEQREQVWTTAPVPILSYETG